jgi:hypothetical protein
MKSNATWIIMADDWARKEVEAAAADYFVMLGKDPQGGGLLHNRKASDRRLVRPTL